MSRLTRGAARLRLASAAMNPAHDPPFGHGERQREEIDSQSTSTAVAIIAAWLIAFACLAVLTLLS